MKTPKTLVVLLVAVVVAGVVGGIPVPVQAAKVSLGAGVGAAPDYEGSEDYEAVPLPFARIAWEDGMFVDLFVNTVKANLLRDKTWRLGVAAHYIQERDDVDNDKVDDLEDVDTAIMLGGFAGFDYQNWNVSVIAVQDIADGNDGSLIILSGGYTFPVSPEFKLPVSLSTTYADEDYMSSYFGIDGDDAARSGLDTYNADAGFKDVSLSLIPTYKIADNWGLMGVVRYSRLIGDAEDSPVVNDEGDENQYLAGILVTYSF